MNAKILVKISNTIGILSILLLIYWIFTFILVNVFGLKIFRENLTETFVMSIMGIIALMAGALMLNIMFNLTRIADKSQEQPPFKHGKKILYGLLALFPIITILAFAGDHLNSLQKQQFLQKSAEKLMQDQQVQIQKITNYRFDRAYIQNAASTIDLLENLDAAVREVRVIVPEKINGSKVYLGFDEYGLRKQPATSHAEQATLQAAANLKQDDPNQPKLEDNTLNKADYIYRLGVDDSRYLDEIFQNNENQPRFKSHDGRYDLFYPYQVDGKTKVVLHFSDYQRYGKFGS